MAWRVYLSGEIHTDWRERIEQGAAAAGLDLEFTAPVTDHAASDAAGTAVLGTQGSKFWDDHIGAGVNAIRTRTLIEQADVVIVRFGEQYKQWNAAFDAGYAAALGKPVVTLHDGELDHALKEVDRAALATARDVSFMVEHRQPVCKLALERTSAPAERLYGTDLGSNYQGQVTMLSKHFEESGGAGAPSP